MSTRKLVFLSLMISLSIVLSIVESTISVFFFTIPGMKLGLANIATMVVVFSLDRKSGLIVAFLRIFLVGLIYSGLFSPAFNISLSGGTLAVLTLVVLKGTKLSIYTISVISASMHMIGQIVAAIFVVNTPTIIYYLPYMLLISIPAGLLTGYLSKKIITDFSQKIINFK